MKPSEWKLRAENLATLLAAAERRAEALTITNRQQYDRLVAQDLIITELQERLSRSCP